VIGEQVKSITEDIIQLRAKERKRYTHSVWPVSCGPIFDDRLVSCGQNSVDKMSNKNGNNSNNSGGSSHNLYRMNGVPPAYSDMAEEVQRGREAKIAHLLKQRKLPEDGWSELEIERLLRHFADMDSNNFPANCGVGEREGRIYSGLVARRHWNMAHGVGRSGDLREPQPKAAGSSTLVALTNSLVVDWLKMNGARGVREAFVAPVATGMAMVLCLMSLRFKRPDAKYVIWSRVDQKSCFKAIMTAGYIPIIVDLMKYEDELRTDKQKIEREILAHNPEEILAVVTTTSCFAPRACDDVPAVAEICGRLQIPHLVNNAYGVQSSKCMHIIEEAGKAEKGRRVDAFVQSTDKNLMVPVGGSVISGYDSEFVRSISRNYPGRASSAPATDVFITLMQLGSCGYKKLTDQRRENFKSLQEAMAKVAAKYGERVLNVKNNPISIAMTLQNFALNPSDPSLKSVSELGSMLFTRGVSGTRVITGRDEKIFADDHVFKGWGSHYDDTRVPYLTAAAAIGMTQHDIDLFIKRLDKVLGIRSKDIAKKQQELMAKQAQLNHQQQQREREQQLRQQQQQQQRPPSAGKTSTQV